MKYLLLFMILFSASVNASLRKVEFSGHTYIEEWNPLNEGQCHFIHDPDCQCLIMKDQEKK